MRNLKKLTLTLVALFAMTTGAWAEDIKATASDIGKVLCTDGSIYATKAEADAANKTAVAIIAYIDTENNKGLALALSNAGSGIWCSLANAFCLGAQYDNTTAITDMDGIANTDALVGHGSHTHTAASSARNYSVTRPEGASAWFLPSAGQWQKMIDAAGGFANLRTNAGMQSGNYWTSTEYNKQRAFLYDFNAGSILSGYKDDPRSVRSAFEFDIVPTAPAGTALSHNDDRTVWTLAAMPAGNVELQVAYFPGMLVKPTSLVGGTMEIEGVTDTALPDGFEKDDAGNIYVEAGKKFTVKAVPAEGYQLVGWSDDATIKDLEREFTMPADGSDFTVTATFSDEFELTFDDVNFKTNQNITVKVGDADKTLDQDGKLSVKSGQTVTLTAKQGYKFRSVEAKKAGVTLLPLTIGSYTIYYAEGDSWTDALQREENKDSGWQILNGNVAGPRGTLYDKNWQQVSGSSKIDPSKGYKFYT